MLSGGQEAKTEEYWGCVLEKLASMGLHRRVRKEATREAGARTFQAAEQPEPRS
jgi:hypothetical protein